MSFSDSSGCRMRFPNGLGRMQVLIFFIDQGIVSGADFIGCMKRGEVYRKPGMRWMEPQHPLLGDHYYTHVWGPAYVVSGRAASFLSSIPEGSLRFLNNEGPSFVHVRY